MRSTRSRDVLDLVLPHVFEGKAEFVADLVANHPADTDPARRGQCFETRRDVDAVTEDVPLIDDDVAEVDSDAELDTTLGRNACVALCHLALHLDGAAYRVDNTRKFDEQAVPGGFNNTAVMLLDAGIGKLASECLHRGERPFLVRPHQPRITSDIGRQDCRQSPMDSFVRHCPRSHPRATAYSV